MTNIFLDRLLDDKSDDDIKKKIKELSSKATLSDNEKRILKLYLDRDALNNVDSIVTDSSATGTSLFGTFDPNKKQIALAEDPHEIGFREKGSTLSHEIGHSFQYKYHNIKNPIFNDLKGPLDKELFADNYARALMGILKIDPKLKDEHLNIDAQMRKFVSAKDSIDMDYLVKKSLGIIENKGEFGGKEDKDRFLRFKQRNNLD